MPEESFAFKSGGSSSMTVEERIQKNKQLMPPQIRVKDFVITKRDLKMVKNIFTRPIEITWLQKDLLARLQGETTALEDASIVDDSMLLSDENNTNDQYNRGRKRKSIEFFQGEDPLCNIGNLFKRIVGINKRQLQIFSMDLHFFSLLIFSS